MELKQVQNATCIALHVTKTFDGAMRIEGSQRPVQSAGAKWHLLD